MDTWQVWISTPPPPQKARAPPCARSSTPSRSRRGGRRGPSSCAAGEPNGISSLRCLTLSTEWRAKNIPLLFSLFLISPSSPESRKDFLKTIHSILREKHRRQLLKTESLPLNQQYVPFGGKRLCALKGARPCINRAGEFQSAAAFTLQQPHGPISQFGSRETSREICRRECEVKVLVAADAVFNFGQRVTFFFTLLQVICNSLHQFLSSHFCE